jgi:repressor LexA
MFAQTGRMALTPRQKEVLDFLVQFSEERGYSPSFEEIASGVGLASLATVHKHITALEQKGYLQRRFNESRSIEISADYKREERERLHPARQGGEVPLLGRIAAGAPVEAINNPESLDFADFSADSNTFALEVRGESMIEDHILSGDYVLVQRTTQVRDGEIVVALVDGSETTLKRIYREDGGAVIRLQPANSTMDPIRVPAEKVQIQGRLLAVLRKFR